MLDTIQRYFNRHMRPAPDGITSRPADAHALRVATAALLVEVTRADHTVTDVERAALRRILGDKFELTGAEVDDLIGMAEAEATEATSLFQFTHLIDKEFTHAQKARVVELLWQVAFADGHLEAHEEAVVRKVADLIHVPHRTFIEAKLKVKAELPVD
ncbi:MAG: TerB family tellurite resistance protein [Nitrospirota bacterium]|nr:TerB family tellurite resistance protein [Nitrospirota bacterium]